MGLWIKDSFGALMHPLLLIGMVAAFAFAMLFVEAPKGGVQTLGAQMESCATRGVSSALGRLGCDPTKKFGPGGLRAAKDRLGGFRSLLPATDR